jgi:acyl-CoA synthetase (AMP-forming)/AMP-acid ligase II
VSDPAARSLVEVLRCRARLHGERRAFTFLADGETESGHLTYAELDRRARALGATLRDAGAARERALLLFPSGLDFVAAFFGCLYAGVVAVPAAPPHPARPGRCGPRLEAIARDAGARIVLTTEAIAGMRPALTARAPELGGAWWLTPGAPAPGAADGWREPEVSAATLAFLQYTSGSTTQPKGVMVSHGNLLHNLRFAAWAAEDDGETVSVSWLPVHHDMGLIEGLLGPVFGGYPAHLMAPAAFLQRPVRWLQAISRVRAVKSGGPNFAYDLCVRRTTPEQRRDLDLRSWRVAYNGAEPIRADTLRRFFEAFRPAGFRWASYYPVYGLAEATLAVSSERRADPPAICRLGAAALAADRVADAPGAGGVDLVACGRPPADTRLVIADPATGHRCGPDRVGEIWVAGPSVAQGYWRRPDLTAETFGARLAGEDAGPFLRTGDLGLQRDGRLVVTGRLKDLVIVRGKKHYPQDLELSAETSHPALRPGGAAAFAVDDPGGERVVLVAEVEPRHVPRDGRAGPPRASHSADLAAAVAAVRQALSEQHELQVHAVTLIAPGGLPKTTSGKQQRHAARAAWEAGTLPLVTEWVRAGETEPAGRALRLTG